MPSKYRYDNGRNGRSKSGGSSAGSSDGRNGRSKSGGSSDVGAGRRERSQRPHRSEKKGRSNHPIYRDQKENIYIAGFEEDNALDSPEPVNYHNMTQQQLEHRRQEEFADQDAMLDQIHHGVKGLKNHAHAINGEIVEQNAMIDDIGNRMDDAQVDLEKQEQHAREVNARKAKMCKLYVVIAILIVILIVLLIL